MTTDDRSPGPDDSAAARWARLRALFDRLQALPPAAREAALAASGADTALQAELRALLAHLQAAETATGQAEGFLQAPAVPADRAAPPPVADRAGQRLGAWRITRLLGRGGMGEVWQAARDDGAYQGHAAIKVLRPGLDSQQVLARFAQEQRVLARLSHPHIAHLLDAGRTADGRPYFVMEQVQGRPIDAACAGLPLVRRLGLFLQLTDAVSHAHRQLLVHRDLKPGNVLVSDEGQVKLLDFGIAKALDPLEGADAGATLAGERPFTPQFASPEQVRGEPVGTATDIYSLGVLLYVMLTGVRPYGRSAGSAIEAARSVLEEEPTRPSALSPQQVPDPQWLVQRRQLQGDLDNILLKTLEKAQDRRYASVDALAADIRAYLDGYPVSARAPSWPYVAGKWLRRHRAVALTGALGLAGLLLGLGLSLWQGREAARARDEARAQLGHVKQIAGELVFRYGDAIALLPGGPKAQEAMLQQTVAALDLTLARAPDDPQLIVLVTQALGRLAQLQGNPSFAAPERAAQADATATRALALADRVWPQARGDWRFAAQHLVTLLTRANLLRGRGQPAEGLKLLALGAERATEAMAATPEAAGRAQLLETRANIWLNHAHFHDHVGRPSLQQPREALRYYDRAEADFRTLYADAALVAALDRESAATAAAEGGEAGDAELWRRHNLANVHAGRALVMQRLDDDAGVRREIEAALRLRELNVAAQPRAQTWRQSLMFDRHTQAVVLLRLAEPQAALAAAQQAWDLAAALRREAGADGGPWAGTQAQFGAAYGRALLANGRADEALAPLQAGLDRLAGQRRQADSALLQQRTAWLQVQRARALAATGQTAAARAALQAAQALLPPLLGEAGETDAAGGSAGAASAPGPAGAAPVPAVPPTVQRDARLVQAEALGVAAELAVADPGRAGTGRQGPSAALLRQQALAALSQAEALAPLAPEPLQWRQRWRAASGAASRSVDGRAPAQGPAGPR